MHRSHSARDTISCAAGFSVLFDVINCVLILAPSSLISFFVSTTNKATDSGQCFSRAGAPLRASCSCWQRFVAGAENLVASAWRTKAGAA
jgi:hypothetical protein